MKEDQQEKIDYLAAQIETLQQVLRITLATMSEQQREFISKSLREYSQNMEESALNLDTDSARQNMSATYQVTENIMNISDWIEYYRSGK